MQKNSLIKYFHNISKESEEDTDNTDSSRRKRLAGSVSKTEA